MSQFFEIHPDNPQQRLIHQAVEILRKGGVIAYPTDSCFALGCMLGEKNALDRIRRIRQVDANHNFTLVCRDLSEIAVYAKVPNSTYRLLKVATPGPYTFILKATNEVPRRMMHPKRRTIGLRVPESLIAHALLEELGEALMSTTLYLPEDDLPLSDAREIRERLEHEVDLVIDGGHCGIEPTTVINLTGDVPEIERYGQGHAALFE